MLVSFYLIYDRIDLNQLVFIVCKHFYLLLQGFALSVEFRLIGVENFYLLEMRIRGLHPDFDRGSWVTHVVDHHVQEELRLL